MEDKDKKKKCDILIVEDSQTQAEMLKYFLEENNFRAYIAENGKVALDFLNHTKVKIIISDILMPELDGYEFCRKVKDDKKLKDIHVILLTTLREPIDIIDGIKAGADNFIVKPYNEDGLLNRIDYILTNESLRKNLKFDVGLDIFIGNKKHKITAERLQILDLLFSTYEAVVDKGKKIEVLNQNLVEADSKLKLINQQLETRIKERTVHLEKEITERRKAEEKLRELLKELKESQTSLIQSEKLSSIGLLTAGIAHELVNPLMGIQNYIEYLIQHSKNNGSKLTILEDADMETKRCIDFAKNLVAFSHKSTGRKEEFVMENCEALVARVIKLLSFRMVKENVKIITAFGKDLPKISMIPDQVLQVFLNLMVNALDALAESKNKKKEIAISIKESGHFLKIEVSDNGTGIPEEIISQIFDPMFTTKETGKGSGLGLSISKNIITTHNGQITCESTEDKGAIFKILLPINKTVKENNHE